MKPQLLAILVSAFFTSCVGLSALRGERISVEQIGPFLVEKYSKPKSRSIVIANPIFISSTKSQLRVNKYDFNPDRSKYAFYMIDDKKNTAVGTADENGVIHRAVGQKPVSPFNETLILRGIRWVSETKVCVIYHGFITIEIIIDLES